MHSPEYSEPGMESRCFPGLHRRSPSGPHVRGDLDVFAVSACVAGSLYYSDHRGLTDNKGQMSIVNILFNVYLLSWSSWADNPHPHSTFPTSSCLHQPTPMPPPPHLPLVALQAAGAAKHPTPMPPPTPPPCLPPPHPHASPYPSSHPTSHWLRSKLLKLPTSYPGSFSYCKTSSDWDSVITWSVGSSMSSPSYPAAWLFSPAPDSSLSGSSRFSSKRTHPLLPLPCWSVSTARSSCHVEDTPHCVEKKQNR